MNERIKELILKAGFPKFDKMYVVSDGEELERFAELIVQECADFVREYPEKYLTHNQASEIGFGMEEHFGVEE